MTGPGTNSYLVGRDELAVVDPGPDDPGHLDRLVEVARARGAVIRWVLVTHTHPDHAPGAAGLAARTGAETVGFGPRDGFEPDRSVGEGWTLSGPGFDLRAVHTPGHASNHLCWLLERPAILLSGDHVMHGSDGGDPPPRRRHGRLPLQPATGPRPDAVRGRHRPGARPADRPAGDGGRRDRGPPTAARAGGGGRPRRRRPGEGRRSPGDRLRRRGRDAPRRGPVLALGPPTQAGGRGTGPRRSCRSTTPEGMSTPSGRPSGPDPLGMLNRCPGASRRRASRGGPGR